MFGEKECKRKEFIKYRLVGNLLLWCVNEIFLFIFFFVELVKFVF